MKALAPGLLIAVPQLGDPNFHRSVVLVVEHSKTGAMGLVLNRVAPLSMRELAANQELEVAEGREGANLFIGGPVEPQRGFVLHDCLDLVEKVEILPGLFMSVTIEALKPLLARPDVRVRLCLGYSGWGPLQLEEEMKGGSWLFTEAAVDAVLDSDPGQLWDETLRGMGLNPLALVPGGGMN